MEAFVFKTMKLFMFTIVWYIHTYFSLTDIPSFYSMEAFAFKTMKSFHVYHCLVYSHLF